MRVLVTGHRGYIGSVMAAVLRNTRFEVVGLDADLYLGCDFGRIRNTEPSFDLDLRDIEFTDLLSFDAVIHLAALPEDAPAELNLSLIREVNEEATVRLAECCKQAGVSRFLLASSYDIYVTFQFASSSKSKPEVLVSLTTASFQSRRLSRTAFLAMKPVFRAREKVFGSARSMKVRYLLLVCAASEKGSLKCPTWTVPSGPRSRRPM